MRKELVPFGDNSKRVAVVLAYNCVAVSDVACSVAEANRVVQRAKRDWKVSCVTTGTNQLNAR